MAAAEFPCPSVHESCAGLHLQLSSDHDKSSRLKRPGEVGKVAPAAYLDDIHVWTTESVLTSPPPLDTPRFSHTFSS